MVLVRDIETVAYLWRVEEINHDVKYVLLSIATSGNILLSYMCTQHNYVHSSTLHGRLHCAPQDFADRASGEKGLVPSWQFGSDAGPKVCLG